MEQKQGWLSCNISEGMLPDEFAVECNSANQGRFSFFAPSNFIDSEQNSVLVELIDGDENYFLVYLPVTPFESMNRTIKVSRSAVQGLQAV
jgi:hypothetical protein